MRLLAPEPFLEQLSCSEILTPDVDVRDGQRARELHVDRAELRVFHTGDLGPNEGGAAAVRALGRRDERRHVRGIGGSRLRDEQVEQGAGAVDVASRLGTL
jgi:hypothetical protein